MGTGRTDGGVTSPSLGGTRGADAPPTVFMAPNQSPAIEAADNLSDDTPRATAWARFRAALALRLGVDPRALATLRILIGTLILLDLAYRVPNLAVFHSDAGVLPRSVFTGFWGDHTPHSLFGAVWVQGVLFVAQAIIALALVVGYRTRTATVLSAVLLVSLQLRNPYILNAGDLLLRALLFWSMFLHLGERWSLDALRRGTPRGHVADIATAGILLQVIIIYALNAFHKIHGGDWTSGDALHYVFQTERYMSPLGLALNDHPALLTLLTRAWFSLLLLAPLLLVTTGRVRIVLVALFAGAHLNMFLMMRIGFFPLVSIAALVPFLPTHVWDLVEHHIARPIGRSEAARRVLATISRAWHTPAKDPSAARIWQRPSWLNGSRSFGASAFLSWIILSASFTAGLEVLPEDIQDELEEYGQRWAMFASPSHHNTWVVMPATLESGRVIDALHRDEEPWDQMRYLNEPYPDFHWRKYLDAIQRPARDYLRTPLADYLCERWNDTNDDKMTSLAIYRVDQQLHLDGNESAPVRTHLSTHECD